MKKRPELRSNLALAFAFMMCLALFIGTATIRAADDADITWLPLTQSSSPSTIAKLRNDILSFIEPYRRKLFGDPKSVNVTTYFITISTVSQKLLPMATSTNTDGTLACVLSAAQFPVYHQRLQAAKGVDQLAAPRSMMLEGMQAKLSVTQTAQISGTNQPYGQNVDLVPRVDGPNLHLRVIADSTELVTNQVPATASAPATEIINIKTMFQSALEVRVPDGGGVAVWHKPAGSKEKAYLFLFSPSVQTNLSVPPGGVRPGKKS